MNKLPRYDFLMLSLTRREQIVLLMILVALLAGAGIRHFRLMCKLPSELTAAVKTH